MRAPDTVVVGGGVVGSAVALGLAAGGQSVWVIDEPEKPYGSATRAAGAMLGAYGEVTADDDQLSSRTRAAALYPAFLAAVDDLAGEPESLLRRGTFVVASGRVASDVVTMRSIVAAVESSEGRWEEVDPSEVPGLSPSPEWPCARAVHLPAEGWIDTGPLLDRLRRALAATARVRWLDARVLRLTAEGDRVTGVEAAGGERIAAGTTVLCAGAMTSSLVPEPFAGAVPAMIWAKGTAVVLRPPSPPPPHVLRTPNRQFACGLHAVPTGASDVYIGATNRAATVPGVTGGASAGEVHGLLHGALNQLQRRWERADVVGLRHGSRPLPADGVPVAGMTEVPGLAVASGTYRNGVLLAPLLADITKQEVLGGGGPTADNPFSPIGRAAALASTVLDPRVVAQQGATDMVATLLDPDGHLPYGRSADIAGLLALLLEQALGAEAATHAPELRHALQGLQRDELVPEVFQLLLRDRGIVEGS